MLYWPQLLTIAYSITSCLSPFIPFWLYQHLKLSTMVISILLSIVYTFRSISGVWPAVVNSQPDLYGKTTVTLIFLSSLGYIPLFVLNKQEEPTIGVCALLLFCSIINGLFYQPLSILINSAIIKILGDYRALFYGSFLRWGDITRIVTTGLIGLIINKTDQDSFGLLLLVVWSVGAVLLSIVVSLQSVQPATLKQLNISDDQAPLLLKSALSRTADQSSIFCTAYKPYSIFGEQLSHISEEDASLLDRALTTEGSLRQMYSYVSNISSYYNQRLMLEQCHSQYTEQEVQGMVHVYALALLPLPTSTDPLVALLSNPEDEEADEELFPRAIYYCQPQYNPNSMKLKNWKLRTLGFTLLLLGIAKALLNTFLFVYVYSILGLSITDIACLIIVQQISETVVHFTIEKWFIHKLNLGLITTLGHVVPILCAIAYPCLEPDHVITQPVLILLQVLQAISFQLVWFSAVDHIHIIVWNQYERMKERSKASALFSSFGTAVGATISGIILQDGLDSYPFLFKTTILVSALSFVVSWGWTSND